MTIRHFSKYDLGDYNTPEEATGFLKMILNKGSLALCLGAGASYDLSLPSWTKLVYDCFIAIDSSTLKLDKNLKSKVESALRLKAQIDSALPLEDDEFINNQFENLSNDDLKNITQAIKGQIKNDSKYFETVQKCLYNNVDFDFSMAKKELLIALSSLIIGRSRGTVQNVMTYNFDSVLEWYLSLNGLKCNVVSPQKLISTNSDVDIIHVHGFLPSKEVADDFDSSDFLVFSQQEFQDRNLDPQNLWKEIMENYFRKNIFLSIGLSEESIRNDMLPHLRILLQNKYTQKGIERKNPFGIAFLSESSDRTFKEDFLANGVIPIYLKSADIPKTIFDIVRLRQS